MSEDLWSITSHIIPASHVRGFVRGVRNEQTDHLRLAIKQYTPKAGIARSDDITLIAATGSGQAKELYEPFFDNLLSHAKLSVRAVWTMDTVHHGESYVLNEDVIGDEPHWLDASRDLLQMVNHFQNEMATPIYGLGQSWGATIIIMASVIHPRLFAGLISIEVVLGADAKVMLGESTMNDLKNRASLVLKRRDCWPSRGNAEESLARNPFFKAFDPEVFKLYIQHELRDAPTAASPLRVQLKTPKSMQAATFMMPDPPLPGFPSGPEYVPGGINETVVPGFYRGEVKNIQRSIPSIYPSFLYLWGKKSNFGMSDHATDAVNHTGLDLGGGGRLAKGQVMSVFMEGVGHTIVLEKPREAAAIIGDWMREHHSTWKAEVAIRRNTQAPFNPGVVHPFWHERPNKLIISIHSPVHPIP